MKASDQVDNPGGSVPQSERLTAAVDVPDAVEGLNRPDPHQYHGSKTLYLKSITDLENRYGVYDSRLVDQLIGLGLTEKSQGEQGKAISAFKRALHIKRVNSGLFSMEQVPILTYLIDSYAAMEDWRSANDKQSLIYSIQQQNYGEGSPRLLAPLNKMVKWHLLAFNKGSGMLHLLRAMDLNRKAIAIIEKNYGVHDPRLNETLYRQALASYHLSEYHQLSQQTSFYQPTSFSQSPSKTMSMADATPTYFNPYRDGKKALLRRVNLFKSNPQLPIRDQVEALVNLGDWYFLFDKKESALGVYREAIKLLDHESEDVEESQMTGIFSRPQALHFEIHDDNGPPGADKKKPLGYVRVKFTVTPGGRARDIEIIESDPPEVKDSQVYRSVKNSRYRPRIVDGKPVLTEGVMEKHVFEY